MATIQPDADRAPAYTRPTLLTKLGARGPAVPIPREIFYPLMAMLVMFVAANSVSSTPTAVINAGKWIPLGAVLVTSLTVLLTRRAPSCPPLMFFSLALMLAMSAVGSFLGIVPVRGTMSLVSVAVVILTGYVVAGALVATDSRRAFFSLIAIIGRVVVVGGVIFYALRINLGRGADGFAAWVDNPNTLAAILAPGIVVFIAGCLERRPGWKLWHLSFLLLSLPLMYVTNGRASFVWILFATLAFWLYRRGSWVTAVAAMAALIVLIGWWEPILGTMQHYLLLDIDPLRTTAPGPLSGRQEVWRIGWRLFLERPTFGYGIGSSQVLLTMESWRFVRFQGIHFHSSYLMVLIETGVLGFSMFMLAMVSTIVRGIRDAQRTHVLPRESWPTAALPFAMVIGGLGHATFESWLIAAGNVNAPMFWICVWLIHFQAQIPIRAVRQRRAAAAQGGRVAFAAQ